MRHLRAGRKLNIDTQHRTALRRNLARSLFLSGRVTTTLAKAKSTRPYVEKLVTRARKAAALKAQGGDDPGPYIHQLRLLRREIPDRAVLALLVDRIAPMCKDRPGGYTRIVREARNQVGDNAPRAIWEFVDRPPETADAPAKGKEKGREKGK
jgi:large subunit ribosomal protein L17